MIKLWIISLFLSINGFLGVLITPDIVPSDLDYSTSLVDWGGENMEIDIYYDPVSITTSETYVMLYIDGAWQWAVYYVFDNETGLYKANLNETQKSQILGVLFNRSDGNQTGTLSYLAFRDDILPNHTTPWNAPTMYIKISFKGLLNTKLKDVLIIDQLRTVTTDPAGDIDFNSARGTLQFRDKNNQIIPIDGDLYLTLWDITTPFKNTGIRKNLYTLDNRITGIKKIEYAFQYSGDIWSLMGGYTSQWTVRIYQIGFFASETVFLPDFDIDPDFQFFEPETAEWWQIGAHLRNFVNGTIEQVALFGEDLSSDLDPVIDIIKKPLNAFPDSGVRAVFGVLIGAISIMLIYKIWRRIS